MCWLRMGIRYLVGEVLNFAYRPPETQKHRTASEKLSPERRYRSRFSNQDWSEWPLTADKYHSWLAHETEIQAPLVNLFMDYETFGEHQWKDTGVFSFFEHFVAKWLSTPGHTFCCRRQGWHSIALLLADGRRSALAYLGGQSDLTAWNGNDLQAEVRALLYEPEEDVLRSGRY